MTSGTSARENLADVREYVELLTKQIKATGTDVPGVFVLDVGAGQGTYADALHGIEDLCLIAMETWKPSVERLRAGHRYDSVIECDVRTERGLNLLRGQDETAVIIFGDVLEHMTAHEAHVVWDAAYSSGAHVIVSVPNKPYPQGAIDGNHLEEHIILDPIPELIDHLPPYTTRWDYVVTSTFVWKKAP